MDQSKPSNARLVLSLFSEDADVTVKGHLGWNLEDRGDNRTSILMCEFIERARLGGTSLLAEMVEDIVLGEGTYEPDCNDEADFISAAIKYMESTRKKREELDAIVAAFKTKTDTEAGIEA